MNVGSSALSLITFRECQFRDGNLLDPNYILVVYHPAVRRRNTSLVVLLFDCRTVFVEHTLQQMFVAFEEIERVQTQASESIIGFLSMIFVTSSV